MVGSTLEKGGLLKATWSYLSLGPAVGAEYPPQSLLGVQWVTQGDWAGESPQDWALCPSAVNLLNGNSGCCSHLRKQKPSWLARGPPVAFLPSPFQNLHIPLRSSRMRGPPPLGLVPLPRLSRPRDRSAPPPARRRS